MRRRNFKAVGLKEDPDPGGYSTNVWNALSFKPPQEKSSYLGTHRKQFEVAC